jgi:DNA-binding Lrp family transcriptional regulator
MQGVVKVYDPATGAGVVVLDADRREASAPRAPSEAYPAGSTIRTAGLPAVRRVRGCTLLTMVQAYVLIQTEVGKAASVADAVRNISGVESADDVTGPYDVIVKAEADNVDDLGRMVVASIQQVDGITRTLTCPVVHL